MCRVHPKVYPSENTNKLSLRLGCDEAAGAKLTVWKRSSMSFRGTDGFTVFDEGGRLAFRVDNYSRSACSKGIVLMDGAGNPLLSLKPQHHHQMMLRKKNQWNAYREDEEVKRLKPKEKLFSMRRRSSTSSSFFRGREDKSKKQAEAEVFVEESPIPAFRIEGCFRSRNCSIIRSDTGEVVAKISRKTVTNSKATVLLSEEVFSLAIQPGTPTQLVMAFVVILDRITMPRSFPPLLCS